GAAADRPRERMCTGSGFNPRSRRPPPPRQEPGRHRHGRIIRPGEPMIVLISALRLTVELEREVDGRWIADVADLPGVMVYGPTGEAALSAAQALALRVLADRLEHGVAVEPPRPSTQG